ncbi:MAG: 1-acyl-sn-glycerol-3-phosphate acyltransferase [Campylobacterales bacterium]|nr:1-acyl-sn-glycerol-3-phosphate acyltransferase [Campylobacterales bacterium]
MDLHKTEERLLALSPFVKEAEVLIQDGFLHALLYPNFEELKSAHIVNIESQLRWYCVELYNMEAKESEKIRNYTISKFPLSQYEPQLAEKEPDDALYKTLKFFLHSICNCEVLLSSHIELDLGLDSLDYVELFVFVEKSFGVFIDEVIFSKIMTMRDLYGYIKVHQKHFNPTRMDWIEMLSEEMNEELISSPYIMFLYKTFLFPFFKLYFRLEVRGLENIPTSPCIIAPTHQSMLDGFLIEATLPYATLKKTFFLAYEAVFGTRFLRPISDNGQTLLIDADNNLIRSMKRCALVLKERKNLVIFPEGARTRDRQLLKFSPFFAMLSKTYNVPIIPVVIDGSFEALRAGKLFPRPAKIRITFLEPIHPQDLSFDAITKLTREAIEKEIERNKSLQ